MSLTTACQGCLCQLQNQTTDTCSAQQVQKLSAHQHGASLQMDVLDDSLVEIDGLEVSVVEPPEPVLDAENLVGRYTIIFKSEDNVLNDIIQAGAQTAASHHCCCHLHMVTSVWRLRVAVNYLRPASPHSDAGCVRSRKALRRVSDGNVNVNSCMVLVPNTCNFWG